MTNRQDLPSARSLGPAHRRADEAPVPRELSPEFRAIAHAAEATRLALSGSVEAIHMSGPLHPTPERPVEIWFLTRTPADDPAALENDIATQLRLRLGPEHADLGRLVVVHATPLSDHDISECIKVAGFGATMNSPHNGAVQQTGGPSEGEGAGDRPQD
jgi:hypothetical protein